MEKKVYVLGGVDFSDKAARWFAVLNRKVGSSAHYEYTNSDQWGRDFGHTGYIVADDDDDLETGLEILQSGKFIFEKGDAMTLSYYWCKNPARGVKIVLNEKRQALATKVADKLNLTSAQWARLANGQRLFIGEYVFSKQSSRENGPAKAFLQIATRGYGSDRNPTIVVERVDGRGWAETWE
jgi:hypothetical protein